jgi:hypothetical protein
MNHVTIYLHFLLQILSHNLLKHGHRTLNSHVCYYDNYFKIFYFKVSMKNRAT